MDKIRAIDSENIYSSRSKKLSFENKEKQRLKENLKNFKIFQEEEKDKEINHILKKIVSQSFEDYKKFDLMNVSGLKFKLSFYEGFNFLFGRNKTNSLGIKIEFDKIDINFTMKSIKILIKNVLQLILINKKEKIIQKKIDVEIPDKVNPIEKLIYKDMITNLKKFKLKLNKVLINFKSNNNLLTDFSLKLNKFNFHNMINLPYKTEKSHKIVNNNIDLYFQDIIIILSEENNQVLNIPDFYLMIVEDINYIREKKEAQVKKSITSEISNFSITAHSEKMNKIMEFIIEIVEGIDKIDTITIPLQKVEFYNHNSEINLNFKNFNITLYNENLILGINNLSMLLKIDQIRFKEQKILISFSPLIVTIANPFDCNRTINNKTSLFNFREKSKSKLRNANFNKKSENFIFNFYSSNNNFNNNNFIFDTNEFYYVSEIELNNNFRIELFNTKEYKNSKIIFFIIIFMNYFYLLL